jgi:Domain of unknown function (DUF4288)
MSWYMAVIVRGSFTEHGYDRNRMGDLLYKLVEAPDAEAAYEKAVALGEAAVDSLHDEEGVEVTLRSLGLADLMEIAGAPADGAEVYSEVIATKPRDRVTEKKALTAFTPWHVPGEGEEDLGEVTELGEIEEPGSDRFRSPETDDR